MNVKKLSLRVCAVIAVLSVAVKLHAADEEPATSEVSNADVKESTDQVTILTRRVWFETEWNKFEDGSSIVEQTLGTLWAWRLSADQDWGAAEASIQVSRRQR
jgi:hypothetical protein